MKQILKGVLTMMCMVWVFMACRTPIHGTVESRTKNVDRQWTAKTDTVSERTADSVLVFVEHGDSIVRIIERIVHTREKVKVVKDTVVYYVQNDTVVKVAVAKEQASRSPPLRKLSLALLFITIVTVAIKLLTLKKHLNYD